MYIYMYICIYIYVSIKNKKIEKIYKNKLTNR